jgi:hypothetical protein
MPWSENYSDLLEKSCLRKMEKLFGLIKQNFSSGFWYFGKTLTSSSLVNICISVDETFYAETLAENWKVRKIIVARGCRPKS